MSKSNVGNGEKKVATTKWNPFGRTAPVRSSLEILQDNFGIGILLYDRGAEQWDANRVDENTGKPAPGWVHVPNQTLECVVEFAVNEGKGTGRQIIPASEFTQYVRALRAIQESDYAERVTSDRTQYIPTFKVAEDSFRMVHPRVQVVGEDGKMKTVEDKTAPRDVVSVRCTGGKGAKPMLVAKAEFPGVVSALEGIASQIEAYQAQAWANYKAQVAAGETPNVEPPTSSDPEVENESADPDELEIDLDDDSQE